MTQVSAQNSQDWKQSGFKKVDPISSTPVEASPILDSEPGFNRVIPSAAAAAQAEPKKSRWSTPPGGTKWWQSPKFKKAAAIGGGVFLVLVLIFGSLGFWTLGKVRSIQADSQVAMAEGRMVYDAFKAQNLPEARAHLDVVKQRLTSVEATYKTLALYSKVPIASKYYNDGTAGLTAAQAGIRAGEKFFTAVEPHADLLGFTGEETYFGTTEDRVGLVLETLSQIAPQLDGIATEIDVMKQELDKIDPMDYPENVKGYPVRQLITQARGGAEAAEIALNEARPALERLPAIAGAEGRRKYLVIFQNDNELRPTGGFMTAYAVVFVENGKVTPEKSDDIYELDQKFRNKPPIPEVLGRYLTSESRWNLRDMNMDPNFENSMDTFYQYYQTIPGEAKDIDGIIAVDTELLKKVVDVIGPVDVPGYGTFSSKTLPVCDCPQIIYMLSEIIDRPTPYLRENRKGILAPMMQAIIQKTYASPREAWPMLAQIGWEGIEGRHIQMYFFNEQDKAAAHAIKAAGTVPDTSVEGDFLTVIDANLAGAKSNLFIETSAEIKVQGVENGRVTKEVELTYRNTHPPSNCNLEAGELCLNGLLNDWSRWYVPKGAQVNDALGFKDGHTIDTSNPNYDVIEGFFTVAPLAQTKVRITYSVPYTLSDDAYQLTIQKQGGLDKIATEVITPWGSEQVDLTADRTFRFAR
jgi:hypothetical protein